MTATKTCPTPCRLRQGLYSPCLAQCAIGNLYPITMENWRSSKVEQASSGSPSTMQTLIALALGEQALMTHHLAPRNPMQCLLTLPLTACRLWWPCPSQPADFACWWPCPHTMQTLVDVAFPFAPCKLWWPCSSHHAEFGGPAPRTT